MSGYTMDQPPLDPVSLYFYSFRCLLLCSLYMSQPVVFLYILYLSFY